MKRGISPLLSFILVLLLALAIYIFLFPWFTTITQKFSEGTEGSSERPLHCDSIYLSVNKVTRKRDEINITINVKNSGTFVIERFTVTRETAYHPESSCLMLNTDLDPNSNKDVVVPIFSPFNLTSSLCPGQISPAQIVPCINIKKIELVPWINVDGVDIACVDRLLEVDVEGANKVCEFVTGACNSGETRLCYTGDQSLIGIGVCWWGEELCVNNAWSGNCDGEVLPSQEICDNKDNDCNTFIDDGIAAQSCYTGIPQSTQNNPPCHAGTWMCNAGAWGPICNGEQTPLQSYDVCNADQTGNGIDEDCDGVVDDGCLVWESQEFEMESNLRSYAYNRCDCGKAPQYSCYNGQEVDRCNWFLPADMPPCGPAGNDCDQLSSDGISCKKGVVGQPIPDDKDHCTFLKNNVIIGDRYFGFNLDLRDSNPIIDPLKLAPNNLNQLECEIEIRVGIGDCQDYEDFFLAAGGVNGERHIYRDDYNSPGCPGSPATNWFIKRLTKRRVGSSLVDDSRYVVGSLVKGNNIIVVGNPGFPQTPGGSPASSTHVDWFKFYCFNPIVNP